MIVTITLSALPYNLRSFIGDRPQMEKFGATLFKTLIEGYLAVQDTPFMIRSMQPFNIHISKDATELQFVDLVSMSEKGIKAQHAVMCKQPYSCISDWDKDLYFGD